MEERPLRVDQREREGGGGECHVCVDLTHLAYDVLSCYGLYRRMLAIILSS